MLWHLNRDHCYVLECIVTNKIMSWKAEKQIIIYKHPPAALGTEDQNLAIGVALGNWI